MKAPILLALLCLIPLGCKAKMAAPRVVVDSSAASQPARPPIKKAAPAPLPKLPVAAPVAGPVSFAPRLPKLEDGMMDHIERAGWTPDSKRFGYCYDEGGSGCYRCRLRTTGDEPADVVDLSDCNKDEPVPGRRRRVRAQVKKLGFPTEGRTWLHGGELELSWRGSGRRVAGGVRRRGDRRGYYPGALRFKATDVGSVHLEAMKVSPDGKWLAMVAHTFQGEYSDTYPVVLIPTSKLAAGAYNTAGFLRHKAGKHAEAATLFLKATAADPDHPLALHNLACAWAKAGDARVRTALARAIGQAGDDARDKARRDKDLDTVRREPWFEELVGGGK